jgi:hypothetical protein
VGFESENTNVIFLYLEVNKGNLFVIIQPEEESVFEKEPVLTWVIAEPLLNLLSRVKDGLVDFDLVCVGINAFHLISHVLLPVSQKVNEDLDVRLLNYKCSWRHSFWTICVWPEKVMPLNRIWQKSL